MKDVVLLCVAGVLARHTKHESDTVETAVLHALRGIFGYGKTPSLKDVRVTLHDEPLALTTALSDVHLETGEMLMVTFE